MAANDSVGVYSLHEAAHLVRADVASVRRWMFGYSYRKPKSDQQRWSGPLWTPQYEESDLGERVIGFRDLMELRVVREFVERGVPLIVVRHCLAVAKKLFGEDYPLTSQRFLTDGETIYHEALRAASAESDGPPLVDLRKRQHVFHSIVKDSLFAGIEYDGHVALRWFPEGKGRPVVVDPAVQFGHASIVNTGVPTAALYAAWLVEGRNRAPVARSFEVEPRHVDAAVRFEEKLRKAA